MHVTRQQAALISSPSEGWCAFGCALPGFPFPQHNLVNKLNSPVFAVLFATAKVPFFRLPFKIASRAAEDAFKEVARRDAIAGCGSISATAVVAVVSGGVLLVANAGDSRAVICSTAGVAETITTDHKPDGGDELARIESLLATSGAQPDAARDSDME